MTDGDRRARLDSIRAVLGNNHGAYSECDARLRFLLSELGRVERQAEQYERDAREWMQQRDAARAAETEALRRERDRYLTLYGREYEYKHATTARIDLAAAQARVRELEHALKVAEHCMDREQVEPSALNIVRAALAGAGGKP
jgi:hypothetical protein